MGDDEDWIVNSYHITVYDILASVAQLVEQRFCKPQVMGSSPFAGFDVERLDFRSKRRFPRDLQSFFGVLGG